MRLPPKMTPAQIARRSGWRASGSASVRPEEPLLVRVGRTCGSREGSFARPTEPAGAPYEVGRCAGPNLSRAAVIRITASMPRRTSSLSFALSLSTSLSALW